MIWVYSLFLQQTVRSVQSLLNQLQFVFAVEFWVNFLDLEMIFEVPHPRVAVCLRLFIVLANGESRWFSRFVSDVSDL